MLYDSILACPPPTRRVIYTTISIESINVRLRKIIKTWGHFPSGGAATKLIWLARGNIAADWGRARRDRKDAMNRFAILYADRVSKSAAQDVGPTCPTPQTQEFEHRQVCAYRLRHSRNQHPLTTGIQAMTDGMIELRAISPG